MSSLESVVTAGRSAVKACTTADDEARSGGTRCEPRQEQVPTAVQATTKLRGRVA
ncbi:hypothetical protein SAMN04488074_12048 [Lentzea albidocapillata subsp. violacea]|uniref:Uncharacterized protein n=1 Tax=Lentzea albidocapillata subsp. violacea TaxID=128104 RepID=A0A1G9SGE3_9PSEU|nr:hypothetical protein SAMN04488074_12048 [Lentzea albidocapillata subsp. violacea]